MKAKSDQVLRAAYHEAGHATAAFHFGHFIKGIEIDAFGSGVLTTRIQEPICTGEKRFFSKQFTLSKRLEEYAICLFSGRVAEAKYSQCEVMPFEFDSFEDFYDEPPEDDYEAVWHQCILANSHLGSYAFTNAHFFEWKFQTQKLFRKPSIWQGTNELAKNLIFEKTLTGDQVNEILSKHLQPVIGLLKIT